MILDNKDLLILKMLHEGNPSIHEMCDAIAVSSTSTVAKRLEKLEDYGYVLQPRKRQPRSREVTDIGLSVLKGAGIVHDGASV